MRRKIILSIVLFSTVLFVLTGCHRNTENDAEETLNTDYINPIEYEPEYGGQLVFPVTTISTLNPLIVENSSYYYFSKLMFEGLFDLDKNFNIVNQLVEDYDLKPNGTISIQLRENVYWHDGQKLSAADVEFTINTIKYASGETAYKEMWDNFTGNFNSSDINKIIEIKVIDSLNIDIVFEPNFSHKLETLTFPIVPKHRFVSEKEGTSSYEKALIKEDYIPIGTGPYEFVDYAKYKTIDLKYYDDYREGRPYIDRIKGKILQDKELALTAFETGKVNLAVATGIDWEKYDKNDSVRIIEFVSQNYEFLGFNFSNEIFESDIGQGLRKAIAYGIDRQSIIQNVYLGHATQTDLPIHPNSWILSHNANVYGYNLEKAKNELQKIGWEDVDGDGFYEDQDGNDIILRLITNSYNSLRLKVAEMIIEDLNELGIRVVKDYTDVIPNNLPKEAEGEQWNMVNDRIIEGDYDMALLGWHLSPISELSFAFHSSNIGSNTNFIKYNNETMDKRLLEAYSATNKENKLKAYEGLQSIIVGDLPYMSLFFENQALLIDSKIIGDVDPTPYDLYRNITQWYIPKEFQ